MTHDLLRSVFGELHAHIDYILINDIRESTYYARIVVNQSGQIIEIDSRPSDAIALAVRTESPIYVAPHVLEQGGTPFDEEESLTPVEPAAPAASTDDPEQETSDEDISIFRNFINTLDIDKDDDSNRNEQQ